jgi:hypothetical protein
LRWLFFLWLCGYVYLHGIFLSVANLRSSSSEQDLEIKTYSVKGMYQELARAVVGLMWYAILSNEKDGMYDAEQMSVVVGEYSRALKSDCRELDKVDVQVTTNMMTF